MDLIDLTDLMDLTAYRPDQENDCQMYLHCELCNLTVRPDNYQIKEVIRDIDIDPDRVGRRDQHYFCAKWIRIMY